VVLRYDELLAQGYRSLDMTPLQEVATPDLALKAYHHMSAIGEGKLRLESKATAVEFTKVELRGAADAHVETRETWDFAHVEMKTGRTFAEEKGFVYEMAYDLRKQAGRWIIVEARTASGESTNSTVPWPKIDREKGVVREPGASR
jgi:hypothetical protein